MKTYKYMTIADVLEWCDAQDPSEEIKGIGEHVHSYRGYYEHISIDPDEGNTHTVASLAEMLRANLGETFTGYKGGAYVMTPDRLLFLAEYGTTGPQLVGFELHPSGDYWAPVGFVDRYTYL